jgi:peptidoglycan/LPS O-acetylase OafA/YrhL
MSKPLIGVIVGLVLGALDGVSALFYGPEVKAMITGIIVGSSIKSMIAGLVVGLVARKAASRRTVLITGLVAGFVLALAVAAMPGENGEHYWLEIIIPGTFVGFILGYVTDRYGRRAVAST